MWKFPNGCTGQGMIDFIGTVVETSVQIAFFEFVLKAPNKIYSKLYMNFAKISLSNFPAITSFCIKSNALNGIIESL